MPKKKVKRCIRPQCMMIYPENTKNVFCDCGALLELAQIEVVNKKNNINTKKANNHNQKKKTPGKKDVITKKLDVSSEKIAEKEIKTEISVEDLKEKAIIDEEISIKEDVGILSVVDEQPDDATEEFDEESENITEELDDEVSDDEASDEIDFFSVDASDSLSEDLQDNVDVDETIDEKIDQEESDEIDFLGTDISDGEIRTDKDIVPEELVDKEEIDAAYLYLLLDNDEEVEYKLGKTTRIGRASDSVEVDIDLTEYAGKDVSREHVVITKEKNGYFITNVSQNHSVRIIDLDENEKAIEYGKKELLKSEEGILLSKKIFLQFVEEK